MSDFPSTFHPGPGASGPAGDARALDAANESLAEALRKSFRVLKLLMFVLVVLYFVSGWVSVKPNEAGIVVRFGKLLSTNVGGKSVPRIFGPGWHWAWPYPIDRWNTFSTSERQIPLKFMFELSEYERTKGEISGYKYNNLRPESDDYLITGDINILHASLILKYQILDVGAYVKNLYPMPAPNASVRSPIQETYPEFTILTNLARDAIIESSARRAALGIRGPHQNEFLIAAARRLKEKLQNLADAGTPLGIEIDQSTAIIAPEDSAIEAIMPPRQTQQVFDQVFAAENKKSGTITKAESEAHKLLLNTAGPVYEELAAAIEDEFSLLLDVSKAQTAEGGSGADRETMAQRRAELDRRRAKTERLLDEASGDVRSVIQNAEIARDGVVKEATGDFARYSKILPEFLEDPEIYFSRLLDETYAFALESNKVVKIYVPRDSKEVRLHIPRSDKPTLEGEGQNGTDTDHTSSSVRTRMRTSPK